MASLTGVTLANDDIDLEEFEFTGPSLWPISREMSSIPTPSLAGHQSPSVRCTLNAC